MAGPAARHPTLVGGIDHHTRYGGHSEIGPKDPGLLWGTICQDGSSRGSAINHTSCTEVHPKVWVPTGWFAMLGCEDETPPDDPSICNGTTVLGRESQSASVWRLQPFGKMCKGANVASGKVHHLLQAGNTGWIRRHPARGWWRWNSTSGFPHHNGQWRCSTYPCTDSTSGEPYKTSWWGGKVRNKCTLVGSESTLPRRWPLWEGVHRECRSALPRGPSELAPWDKEEKSVDSMNAPGPAGPLYPWQSQV